MLTDQFNGFIGSAFLEVKANQGFGAIKDPLTPHPFG
jgi:hypothetical protein